MEKEIQHFLKYMETERYASSNTVVSYERDLKQMMQYLQKQGIESVTEVNAANLQEYLLFMKENGKKSATVSRAVAAMKAFGHYLFLFHILKNDPTVYLKAPKIEKKMPETLTLEETEKLLKQPSGQEPKALRDRAMLELLYATGIRVSELISLKEQDLNLKMEYLSCKDRNGGRVIPIGKAAKDALTVYLETGRGQIVDESQCDYLFTNCSGKPMSRQGFWKLIKGYGKQAGIQKEITPHILRHSFAMHLVTNGAELKIVQEMLGHTSIAATQIYAQCSEGKMREEYLRAHPRST